MEGPKNMAPQIDGEKWTWPGYRITGSIREGGTLKTTVWPHEGEYVLKVWTNGERQADRDRISPLIDELREIETRMHIEHAEKLAKRAAASESAKS